MDNTMALGTCTYTVQEAEPKGDDCFVITSTPADGFWEWASWLQETKKLVTINGHGGFHVETAYRSGDVVELLCRRWKK